MRKRKNTFSFGQNSLSKLNTCHPDLQKIMKLAISRTNIDFGISEGHRSIERQQQLFIKGKTKIDGINKLGKHNHFPSLAVDVYIYHPDRKTRQHIDYDLIHLAAVASLVDCCAKELYEKGEVSHLIRWGGNWDSDGVIDYDQVFDDYPHLELINPTRL